MQTIKYIIIFYSNLIYRYYNIMSLNTFSKTLFEKEYSLSSHLESYLSVLLKLNALRPVVRL